MIKTAADVLYGNYKTLFARDVFKSLLLAERSLNESICMKTPVGDM